MLFKPVVALCKLVFEHIRVFGADRVKSVVLRGNVDSFLRFFLLCPLIDERELHRHGSVKVIEEVAPVFKNGGLVVCLCKLIVALKSDFILSLCELVIGGKEGLQPVEKTVIDRAVRNVYCLFLADPDPAKMPILGDLYDELLKQPEPEGLRIAAALELYVSGNSPLMWQERK